MSEIERKNVSRPGFLLSATLAAACSTLSPQGSTVAHPQVHPAQPPPKATPAADSADALLELLRVSASDEPEECVEARKRATSGISTEDVLWEAVHCASWALKDDPDRMQALIALSHEVHTRHSSWFLTVDRTPKSDPATVCTAWVKLGELGIDTGSQSSLRLFVPDRATYAKLTETTCHLGSGPYRGVCLPLMNGSGHYVVTRDAARAANKTGTLFSAAAIKILADASQDPDFFAWKKMVAHAQTESHEGEPLPSTDAQKAFVEYFRGLARQAGEQCTTQDVARSLHTLGYALHTVQDMMSHRGRTNPEHAHNAYRESCEDAKPCSAGDSDCYSRLGVCKGEDTDCFVGDGSCNPDAMLASTSMAEDVTKRALGWLAGHGLKHCVPAWSKYAGAEVTFRTKRTWGYEMDFSPLEVLRYRRSKNDFAAARDRNQHDTKKNLRVRWFGEQNFSRDLCTWENGSPTACGELMLRALTL